MKQRLVGGSIATLGLILLLLLIVGGPSSTGARHRPVREIVLEARDLAFGGSNPTLSVAPGERVRLVVRNTDPGILHSIALPGIDSTVRQVVWGEEIAVEFTAPEGGSWEYVCPQHLPKMRGRIEVRAE